MEFRQFNRDDIPNINPEKLHTAVIAAEVGKSLAGLVLMIFVCVKLNFLQAFVNADDEFLHIMGIGIRVLLVIFFVLLLVSFIENLILLIFMARGEQDTPRMLMLLKISGVMRSGAGFFFMFVFGMLFGGFGAFAIFSTNVTKAEGTEIFGAIFMLIGIGLCISAIVSFVKMLIKELNS